MKTFEYVVQDYSDLDAKSKNHYLKIWGNDGWELVSVDKGIAYFKREVEVSDGDWGD